MARLTELKDRVAVVTGASSGIGEAMAVALAAAGARVALVARREDRLEALAARLTRGGAQVSIHPCDVASVDAVEAAARAVIERWGTIDLLFNNAGFASHALFVDEPLDRIEGMMRTNYLGVVHWIRAVLPTMRRQGSGFVVNVSSFAGKVGQPDEAAYSASKAAITALSEGLVHELAPLGIHVLCVHPVLVRTEMFTPEVLARMPRGMEKRFIEPEAFAADVLRSLARGETELTVPRSYAGIYLLRALFPGLMSRKMGQVKMERLQASAQGTKERA